MAQRRKNYDDAVRMYDAGLSIGETANAFGITRQAMHKILQRRGVRFRPQKRHGKNNHFYRGGAVKNAALIVVKAVRKGILQVQPCEVCGLVPEIINGRQRIHAHHDDYNHLLVVRWLCKKHHDEWHLKNKPIRRSADWKPMDHAQIASMGGRAAWAKHRKTAEVQLAAARSKRWGKS